MAALAARNADHGLVLTLDIKSDLHCDNADSWFLHAADSRNVLRQNVTGAS
jgi:hypothetical protein